MDDITQVSLKELTELHRTGRLKPSLCYDLAADPRRGVQELLAKWVKERSAVRAEQRRVGAMLKYEKNLWDQGLCRVGGVDEVGVGPLAGPVVAAAVVLPARYRLPEVNDSKKLSAAKRAELAQTIKKDALGFGIGMCTAQEVDRLNIYWAALEAMKRAVIALMDISGAAPEHLLVDARRVPGVGMAQTSIVKGDTCSQSIAAASIVAKVARDSLMATYGREYPVYGFERHVGYGTAEHLQALREHGPCPIHRLSFAPVQQALHRLEAMPKHADAMQ